MKLNCGDHGTFNLDVCICKDGWSGNVCNIPPENPCFNNKDCGNFGKYGTCESYTGTCNCPNGLYGDRCQQTCLENKDCGTGICTTEGLCDCIDGWTGRTCENPPPNWKCKINSSCGIYARECNNGKCICIPGYSGALCNKKDKPDPNTKSGIAEMITEAIKNMISTPQGIATLVVFLGLGKLQHFVIQVIKNKAKQIAEDATEEAQNFIFGDIELADLTVDDVVNSAVLNTVSNVVMEETAISLSLELLADIGTVIGIATAIVGVVGVVLDMADVLGLNEKMTNTFIELFRIQLYKGINSGHKIKTMGLKFPLEWIPLLNTNYQKIMKQKKNNQKYINYFREYISNLQVNSNGNKIIIIGTNRNNSKTFFQKYKTIFIIITVIILLIFLALNIFKYS